MRPLYDLQSVVVESKVIPFHWTKKIDKNNLPKKKKCKTKITKPPPIRGALKKKNFVCTSNKSPGIGVFLIWKKILSWKVGTCQPSNFWGRFRIPRKQTWPCRGGPCWVFHPERQQQKIICGFYVDFMLLFHGFFCFVWRGPKNCCCSFILP